LKIEDIIFWMPWPPPWWVWALAAIVVLAAAIIFGIAR
jgi:hypothetical protein